MATRDNPFVEPPESDLDLSDFEPAPARKDIDKQQLEALGRATGFDRSTTAPTPPPRIEVPPAALSAAAPPQVSPLPVAVKNRYRTGRDVQMNIKCSPATKQRFAVLAQSRNLSHAELFEQLLESFDQRKR